MDNVLVSVICKTYNHERYIRQCLQGLVNQKTDFKYEIIIHDDASLDKTPEIVKEFENKYPEKIVAIYQKDNQLSKHIDSTKVFIFPKCRGKYIAICEGDDFWLDNCKLQKQIDFLETHPDYVLCGHSAYYANEDGSLQNKRYFNYGKHDRTLTTEEIISDWLMATNSIVYKFSALKDYPIPYLGKARNGDYALMTYLALQGKVYFIDELMSAYRVSSRGSINWGWRKNPDIYAKNLEAFIDLLEGLNEYSGHKYESVIKEVQEKKRFEILLNRGEYTNARKMKKYYSQLSFLSRAKLLFYFLFPNVYLMIQKLKYR